MIGFVRGKLVVKAPPHLTVDVGGVGYDIEAPMSTFYTLPAIGSEVRLLTHLVVREDAHILYGFGTQEERALYEQLGRSRHVARIEARTMFANTLGNWDED